LGKVFLTLIGIPFYQFVRLSKAIAKRFFVGDTSIGAIIGQRSLIYGIFIVISFFVITSNLQAQETRVDIESFGQKSLLASLVTDHGGETITEVSAQLPNTGIVNYFDHNTTIGATVPPSSQAAIAQADLLDKEQLIGTTQDNSAVLKSEIPGTEPIIASQRTDIIDYTVEIGDTVSTLAEKFGVSINTILWENNLSARDYIRPGDKLRILPKTGIRYTVQTGDSLEKIAKKYDADVTKIVKSNRLANIDDIQAGQKLFIPGGRKPFTPPPTPIPRKTIVERITERLIPKSTHSITSSKMLWPTPGHVITQYFSWHHGGLDIDGDMTSPIFAAESGTVITAGWNKYGYGIQVLINHGNGVVTRYAHLSKLWVEKGQPVSQGQTIGIMGSTGHSTGSHLHFEVIIKGKRVNPLNYIR